MKFGSKRNFSGAECHGFKPIERVSKGYYSSHRLTSKRAIKPAALSAERSDVKRGCGNLNGV